MLPLTKPKRFIPIHDEFRMQVQHRRLDGRVALIPMNQATGHDLRAPHEFPRLLVDRDVPLSSSPRWRRVPPRRRQIEQIIEPDEWWPDENRTDVLSAPDRSWTCNYARVRIYSCTGSCLSNQMATNCAQRKRHGGDDGKPNA